jgi:hypothetical protein
VHNLGASALLSLIGEKDLRMPRINKTSTMIKEENHQCSSSPIVVLQEETETVQSRRSLEMKLAMNNDVMTSYSPQSITQILGQDLSSYHRVNGRDVIMNQVVTRTDETTSQESSQYNLNNQNQCRDQLNSSCQQSNSKMDTPILNRKIHRTWSSSGFVRKGCHIT